jgi:hypothetical protein
VCGLFSSQVYEGKSATGDTSSFDSDLTNFLVECGGGVLYLCFNRSTGIVPTFELQEDNYNNYLIATTAVCRKTEISSHFKYYSVHDHLTN